MEVLVITWEKIMNVFAHLDSLENTAQRMSMNVKQMSTLALMGAPVLICMEPTNVYVLKDGVDPSVTMTPMNVTAVPARTMGSVSTQREAICANVPQAGPATDVKETKMSV